MGTRITQVAVGNNIIQSADSVTEEDISMTTMVAPRTITRDDVRGVIRSFCQGGKRVSHVQLYEVMGLTCEPEKDRLRARCGDMAKQGELIRVAAGLYEYNFKYRPRTGAESFAKLWKFIRSQKAGWSITQASQLTRVSYTQAARYFGWLENEGYLTRYGKDGQTILYRGTDKADKAPEVPYPPITDRNPFEKENAAAAQIARLMLCHDPYQAKTARDIVAACKVLLARFEKGVTQLENEGETA